MFFEQAFPVAAMAIHESLDARRRRAGVRLLLAAGPVEQLYQPQVYQRLAGAHEAGTAKAIGFSNLVAFG